MPKQHITEHKHKELWDNDTKLEAAAIYANKGTYQAVVRAMPHLPRETVREWGKSDEWLAIIAEHRQLNKDRHITVYDKIVTKATKRVLKTLDQASAKDSMVIAGIAQDKGRILQVLPNSYKGEGEGIQELLATFRKISQESAVKALEGKELIQVIDIKEPSLKWRRRGKLGKRYNGYNTLPYTCSILKGFVL